MTRSKNILLVVVPVARADDRVKAVVPSAEVVGVDAITGFVDAPTGRFDAMFTGVDRASVCTDPIGNRSRIG